MKYSFLWAAVLAAVLAPACRVAHLDPVEEQEPPKEPVVLLEDVARILACVPLESEQLEEVYDAAHASAVNGYDEEYRMQELFEEPGSGVGGGQTKADGYRKPLRELIREAALATKADGGLEDPDAWLEALSSSDVQIYWPFSEAWNGDSFPVITFDPGGDAPQNEGYAVGPDGQVTKVLVTEQMAREQPVWVINRNSDADYKTLEMLRREDPTWGQGGGDILVTKSSSDETRTLVLRSFKARRQFDSWFAGASEFWVKIGSIEDFTASTEGELRLYEPTITDFIVVVRRGQVEEFVPFNAILVSDWTTQLTSCALMIIEDDGGTQTSWKCSATVKYESKAYGFDVELPLRTRDDIVWRGNLTRTFVEKNSGHTISLGDVQLVLELI